MKALIRNGADVKRRTPGGHTYLMIAATAAQPETVAVLVAAGCPVDYQRSPDGETALMIAASWDTGMTESLLAAGASVKTRDAKGATPLIHAIRGAKDENEYNRSPGEWDPRIIRMLLDAGADPAARDYSGQGIASLVAESGRFRPEIEELFRNVNAAK